MLPCRLCNLEKSCVNHETVNKGLIWILMKHDHTNLRVNKYWGETYLTNEISDSHFPFCNTVKRSNLSYKPKFCYEAKSKRKFCRCI